MALHSQGEGLASRAAARVVLCRPLAGATPGRRFQVEWDPHAPVIPLGHLVFFAPFPAAAGVELAECVGALRRVRAAAGGGDEPTAVVVRGGAAGRERSAGVLRLTSTHAQAARELFSGLSLFCSGLLNTVEQWNADQRWERICEPILQPAAAPARPAVRSQRVKGAGREC